MHVSEHFRLGLTQPSLEFVDVDVARDTKAFIDPKVLKDIDSVWANECVALLQDFFSTVIRKIIEGNQDEAVELLGKLSEPNETRLGLSRERANGSAVGDELSTDISDALASSEAARTGLLEDLEDTALFIPGISYDRISDMTTNIIRPQLIRYTELMMMKYPSIQATNDVYVGPIWDRHTHSWKVQYFNVPIADGRPILVVPKWLVRRKKTTFNPGDYLNYHILPELQEREFSANSSLVEVLKDGRRRVTKISVKRKEGLARKPDSSEDTPVRAAKDLNLEVTLSKPELLDEYRQENPHALPPLTHDELAEVTQTPLPDWDELLQKVLNIPTGRADATRYHLAVEELLTALFYPALDFMKHEYKINQGRKRVDITYTNIARNGFFDWVNRVVNAPAHEVYIECKNYTKDVGNPELDQMIGRFSDHRSRVGLMLYRSTTNQQQIDASCRDTALAGSGFILAISDNDLVRLVGERKRNPDSIDFPILREIYSRLV
jgi:hypothetical protein